MEYRTETIDTAAGEYVVELHYDDDAENPLTGWDHPGMTFYVFNPGRRSDADVLTDTTSEAGAAGETLRELIYRGWSDPNGIERRYAIWRAIAGNPWVLVSGSDDASRSDHYRWYVLVDTSADWTDPIAAARATMADYRTYAAGEVCGYVVKTPDGDAIDSCWGFYDDDEALEQGKGSAEYDARERTAAANLVGAGIVGLI